MAWGPGDGKGKCGTCCPSSYRYSPESRELRCRSKGACNFVKRLDPAIGLYHSCTYTRCSLTLLAHLQVVSSHTLTLTHSLSLSLSLSLKHIDPPILNHSDRQQHRLKPPEQTSSCSYCTSYLTQAYSTTNPAHKCNESHIIRGVFRHPEPTPG